MPTRPPQHRQSDPATATSPALPDLRAFGRRRLKTMLQGGAEVLECMRALQKGGANLVSEVLRGQGTFYEWNHYPDGDVFDHESHAQYYYHAHGMRPGEHGHFHTFLRAAGMPAGVQPVPQPRGGEPWPAGNEALSHLVAIGMDSYGAPIRLFATNRWVTGETWYAARDVVRMLERFRIDHAVPSWPVNRWLGGMLRLFEPEIEALIRQRDQTLAAWAAQHPRQDALEDPALEITGTLDISIEGQIARIRDALSAGS